MRARSVPFSIAGLVVTAMVAWAISEHLAGHEGGVENRLPVVVWAPVLAAALISMNAAGADEELDRCTPARWPRLRMALVLPAIVIAAGGLTLTGLAEPYTFGALALIRNVAGFAGLAVASAALLGVRTAWTVPLGYAALVYVVGLADVRPGTAWWTWPVQPSEVVHGMWAAGVLLVTGLWLYAWRGARAVAVREP